MVGVHLITCETVQCLNFDTKLRTKGGTDLRTAAYVLVINKIAVAYMQFGDFPGSERFLNFLFWEINHAQRKGRSYKTHTGVE